jgi:hemoglobin/transferrin/lactoferrin receptor protein
MSLAILSFVGSIGAEETNFAAITLPEVVVTGAVHHVMMEVGTPMATVDRMVLRQKLFRTTPQALREIPGVMVQETSHGQGSPYIRGFTGFRNLFTIDGIRMNNSVFRVGPNQYWNTVDPYLIDRLEISKGTAGVIGGSDAVGGSVNAISQSSLEYATGDAPVATAVYRVSSAENSQVGRIEAWLPNGERTALLAGATLKHFGDLIGGEDVGRQPNTGYDEWDVDVKLEHRTVADALVSLAYQNTRLEDVPRTHRTVFAQSFAGTAVGTELQRSLDQQRQLAYAQLRLVSPNVWMDSLTTSASWQRQQEARFRLRGGPLRTDQQGFTVDTFGLWSRAESDTGIGRLTYGFDYYRDFVDSFSSGNTIRGPVGDEANYDLFGVYVDDTIDLAPGWEWSLGSRYNYAAANADSVRDPLTTLGTSISRDWHSAVGETRIRWQAIPDQLHWHAGISQGFRAPNLSDLTRFDISRSGEVETAAFNLDQEKFLGFESGLKYMQSAVTAELSGFYTLIEDQIVRFPTGALIGGLPEVTKGNVGDGYVQGVELGLAWQPIDQWTLFGNLAWIEGQVDNFPTAAPVVRREYLDRLMPLTALVGLRWDSPTKRWWSEAVAMLADRADKLSSRDAADAQRIPPGGTPGYAVLNLRGGWKLSNSFTASAAIENALDADYRIHGSGQNMTGRNFILEMTVRF